MAAYVRALAASGVKFATLRGIHGTGNIPLQDLQFTIPLINSRNGGDKRPMRLAAMQRGL